ncbi:dihydrodipicolinate synthase family protein [Sagittula sp. P11]|jgi:4-hydroxy-tetrahydrodipicolinate synthase|uniref:dihydrodipicolinate synthase family protein n=1 Tax=unclassified Sagittula TaxID=2624628 RepID=UPI000C2D4DC6|nr:MULTISPECIES: dihydrodipicolinate synthase family protein [unclassified Sagittula]AUC53868.1 dihydrodipicolinate synthase family protein [Sagittula sp. P11]WHZ34740.1 dihydrodipicolinate synthase family protein [Sagittula sp. MA-2]
MPSDLHKSLTGVSGILVTPFDEAGEIAPDLQRPIVERAIEAGVHVLTANGNTGEFYGLTLEEAQAMVHAAGQHIDDRVPMVAGVGRGVRDAQALAEASGLAGASALMIHQPPDPFVSPRGLVHYVEAVREAGDGLPIVLYLRNDAIGTDAIRAMCLIDGVIGVKWATPNPMKLKAAIAACPDDIVWTGGLAEVWAPTFYAVGARGFTSGLINVWPERSVAINTALEGGDYDEARSLIAGMQVFEDIRAEEQGGANVPGVKAALQMMGEDCGAARPPAAWPLSDSQRQRLETFMTANGLI